jgi:hypothetical protein
MSRESAIPIFYRKEKRKRGSYTKYEPEMKTKSKENGNRPITTTR